MLKYTDEMMELDKELIHFHYNQNGRFAGRVKMADTLAGIWVRATLSGLFESRLNTRIERDKMDWRPWFIVEDRNGNESGRYCYAKDLIKAIENKYKSGSNAGLINTKWSEWIDSGGLSDYLTKTYGASYDVNYMSNDYVEVFVDDEHYDYIAEDGGYEDFYLMVEFKNDCRLDVSIEELIDFNKIEFYKKSEMVEVD